MRCAADVALFDLASTSSSCLSNRFDAMLNEMYSPMMKIASPESASVMMTVRGVGYRAGATT